jgi:hypothetical protein
MGRDFDLLKRTYPISQFDRVCDGYQYLLDNTTPRERKRRGIQKKKLQRVIKKGEKYIYQVAKEGREFRTMCLSFSNYEIIRKHIFGHDDNTL